MCANVYQYVPKQIWWAMLLNLLISLEIINYLPGFSLWLTNFAKHMSNRWHMGAIFPSHPASNLQ